MFADCSVGNACSWKTFVGGWRLLYVSLDLPLPVYNKPWLSKGGCLLLSSPRTLDPVAMATEIRGGELLTPDCVISLLRSICSRCS
jgi:hypothetical protein